MKEVTKIVFNGREYSGVEQMPPEIREQYLQAVAALRGAEDGSGGGVVVTSGPAEVVVKKSIVYNGQHYNSLDELPPEVRQLVAKMSPTEPGESKSLLEIKTSKTFSPRTEISPGWVEDNDGKPVEEDPNVAWLLVKILVVVVLILLFLLFLSGQKHVGL